MARARRSAGKSSRSKSIRSRHPAAKAKNEAADGENEVTDGAAVDNGKGGGVAVGESNGGSTVDDGGIEASTTETDVDLIIDLDELEASSDLAEVEPSSKPTKRAARTVSSNTSSATSSPTASSTGGPAVRKPGARKKPSGRANRSGAAERAVGDELEPDDSSSVDGGGAPVAPPADESKEQARRSLWSGSKADAPSDEAQPGDESKDVDVVERPKSASSTSAAAKRRRAKAERTQRDAAPAGTSVAKAENGSKGKRALWSSGTEGADDRAEKYAETKVDGAAAEDGAAVADAPAKAEAAKPRPTQTDREKKRRTKAPASARSRKQQKTDSDQSKRRDRLFRDTDDQPKEPVEILADSADATRQVAPAHDADAVAPVERAAARSSAERAAADDAGESRNGWSSGARKPRSKSPIVAPVGARAEANDDYRSDLPVAEEANADYRTIGQLAGAETVDVASSNGNLNGHGAADPTDGGTKRPRASFQQRRVFAAVVLTLALMINAAAVGYIVAESRPDVWGAEAEVVLNPSDSQIDRYLATQVVLAQSSMVLERAAAELPVERQYIEDNIDVSPIDASVALSIEFADEDPELALSVVEAVVASYLGEVQTETTSTARAVYLTRIEELRTARAEIEIDLARVESENAAAEALDLTLPNPTEERRLGLESSQILDQIAGLEEQLLVTDIQILNENDATIVSQPELLDERVAPTPITAAALGALVGGVVAAAVIFLVAQSRSRRQDA